MKRLIASGFACLPLVASVCGQVGTLKLGPGFTSDAVFQHDQVCPVFGVDRPGAAITVRFAGQTHRTRADMNGDWRVNLAPLAPQMTPQTLTVVGTARLTCTNILVGEVWLAAGQSNMEWPLAGEAHAAEELPAATNALLRLLNLQYAGQGSGAAPLGSNALGRMQPETFYSGAWQTCSPESASGFSAVAYYFGRDLQRAIGMPVGVVHLAVGGSPTEAWIRRSALAGEPELRGMVVGDWTTNAALEAWCRERAGQHLGAALASGRRVPGDDLGPNHPFKPGFLWDAGPARLLPLAIRGVLWYQGESNSLEPRRLIQHETLFPLLVRDWREQWGQKRLPFLYCQLSAISTNGGYKASCWPEFRDQQRRFLDTIPDTAMAVTSDIGHPTDVHPRNKRDVGYRLALAALARVYDQGNEFSGPQVERATRRGGKVVVVFRHADGLQTADGQPPNGFEVAAARGEFLPAIASIDGNAVVLSNASVRRPTRVRHAWQPFPQPRQNLVNASRLPASTFAIPVTDGLIR